jgi:tyrosyl-tRNA synthetase
LFNGGPNAAAVPTRELALGGARPAVVDFIVSAGFASSKSEARRLIEQGGLTVDGKKITDAKAAIELPLDGESVMLQKGKKSFLKVVIK